ncbi:aminotransferase class III-fold pyridoxal phosphate-dependent enzyme [Roseobacteraceae bacterium S113]
MARAGGLLICDEVQSGFGRIGSHMWAHERMGVVPDVMVLGKPMANGHPVGAVVTTSDILGTFREKYRYFNTFGGNPVSCAAALAVLDELEEADLMANAAQVGAYAQERLAELQTRHEVIGDTRGAGLVFGAELVLDRTAKTPATAYTDRVINAMRARGVLHSKLGRHKNTLKIRPPMPFSKENADLLFDTLDEVLRLLPVSP